MFATGNHSGTARLNHQLCERMLCAGGLLNKHCPTNDLIQHVHFGSLGFSLADVTDHSMRAALHLLVFRTRQIPATPFVVGAGVTGQAAL